MLYFPVLAWQNDRRSRSPRLRVRAPKEVIELDILLVFWGNTSNYRRICTQRA